MTEPRNVDSSAHLATLALSDGSTVGYASLDSLEAAGLTTIDSLPFTIRILLENVLRNRWI